MINGNVTAQLQKRQTIKTDIGEDRISYITKKKIKGWLDYRSGEKTYEAYQSQIAETTHIFIADYFKNYSADRMIINGNSYDVLYIDNPMGLNQHLEYYLKQVK